MVDGVTADEDKIAPVYKLEEICELLRTSPAGIVKEVSEYILKRLDHKSPIVKQKVCGLIFSLCFCSFLLKKLGSLCFSEDYVGIKLQGVANLCF